MNGATLPSADAVQPFSERYAHRAIGVHAGTALFIVFGAMPVDRWFPFFAMVGVVLCSFLFRRRHMHDEQRRSEVMEDERDHAILSRASVGFRIAVCVWYISLAVALALPAVAAVLPQGHSGLPSLLLLGVVVAQLVEQGVVAWLYRRART